MAKLQTGPTDLYGLPPTVGYESHDLRKQRLPQYSFGTRTQPKDNSIGPGPARYQVDKLVRYGISKANIYTMAPKTFYREKSKSPGPLAYQLRNSPIFKGSNSPAYSLGLVNTYFFKNCSPSLNTYGINDSFTKQRAPEYSLGVKKYLPELVRSPGPAKYPRSNLAAIKPSTPSYTLAPRTKYEFKLYGPGSNYYDRMEYKPGKRAPNYSFGVRHSPRSGVMIVPCDNW
ncbi:outer dense fiber protein 3-like protein 2 [Musca domestica]|uniref:Outer dense fiber protein 3-like protein 2 n=1 Tax=Musca domestica TaxID=7370 RepID=A0A9J7IER1_MUSDO|nr:outer dense fiber protein 3-like protein 2 [Musca domestica]